MLVKPTINEICKIVHKLAIKLHIVYGFAYKCINSTWVTRLQQQQNLTANQCE